MSKSSRSVKGIGSSHEANAGTIVATSQQSRFALDAVDAPTTKEVDLKDLTVAIGGKEVLDHANLRIREGVHYVFAGANGTGKSTVLRALAERRIPGVPANIRILLLGQTRISTDEIDEGEVQQDNSQSVISRVTKSDAKRERYLREYNLLSAAVEGKVDKSQDTIKIIRQVKLERTKRDLAEARLIAERRSGARGASARRILNAQEDAVAAAQASLENLTVTDGDADEIAAGIEMLESLRLELDNLDAGSTEARARTVLLGLGFSATQIEGPVNALSGGWRTRCDLACALVQNTDILLLDEPTNFLDLPAVIWLQKYISETLKDKSVVIVTHDRDFADAIAEELILLRLVPAKSIETFRGNLTEYENEKRRQIKRMTKMSEAQDKKKQHMEESIENNLKAAKRTGDDKKLKQAAARKKKLVERTGLEVGLSGGRFKLNRDLAGWHLGVRADLDIPEFDPPATMTFPEQPTELRHPGPLVSLEKVSFTYPKSGVWTLKDVDLVMHPGARVGLAGLNGSGKSTMVKLIVNAYTAGDIKPNKGSINLHPKARIGHFSQHAVEELEAVGLREPSRTALQHFTETIGEGATEQQVRGGLAKFGLRGAVASDVPIKALSGGQRVRLALAAVTYDSPHLLILDEVTTHLDADTIVALIESLQAWEGALLIVTHDRYFMRCVVERERIENKRGMDDDDDDAAEDEEETKEPGVVYRLRKATLQRLESGMDQYVELVEKSLAKLVA